MLFYIFTLRDALTSEHDHHVHSNMPINPVKSFFVRKNFLTSKTNVVFSFNPSLRDLSSFYSEFFSLSTGL